MSPKGFSHDPVATRAMRVASLTKHGEGGRGRRSREYSAWYAAKQRCFNEKLLVS